MAKGTYARRGYGDIVSTSARSASSTTRTSTSAAAAGRAYAPSASCRSRRQQRASPVQCPFCKPHGYSVEFRGQKTEAERTAQQKEEAEVAAAVARRSRTPTRRGARAGEATVGTAAKHGNRGSEHRGPPRRVRKHQRQRRRRASPRLGGGIRRDDASGPDPSQAGSMGQSTTHARRVASRQAQYRGRISSRQQARARRRERARTG